MAGTSEADRLNNRVGIHRPGLVERACRKIIEIDPDYDCTHVFAGTAGRLDAAEISTIIARRKDVRALIGTILFVVAVLLYGALLAGIDAAEDHAKHLSMPVDAERVMPPATETGCYYAATAVMVAVRGGG